MVIPLENAFQRSLVNVFVRKQKPAKALRFFERRYPMVYSFIISSLSMNTCPLCGMSFKSFMGFPPHLKSIKCHEDWITLLSSMVGRNKLTEDEVLDILNAIRMRNGLPPAG